MSTRIDFYLLQDVDALARRRFCCRLAHRAVSGGNRVHVRAGEEDAEDLDALMWAYPHEQFLPHARLRAGEEQAEPVLIFGTDQTAQGDVLINLGPDIPDCIPRFERVAEIVLGSEREDGRIRYRTYREKGFTLFHHEVDDWD